MEKGFKKVISSILVLTFILTTLSSVLVGAEEIKLDTSLEAEEYTKYADELNKLGLFKGTNQGYELDREATRTEAIVMLIRLLGEEEAALKCTATNPFEDTPSWAKSYISYAYDKGYTKGVSETSLGARDKVTSQQYCTFILRALGYSDANGDFEWNKSVDKCKELNIITDEISEKYNNVDNEFLRGDVTNISFLSLKAELNNSDDLLINKLLGNRTVSLDAIQETSLASVLTNKTNDEEKNNEEITNEDTKKALDEPISLTLEVVEDEIFSFDDSDYQYMCVRFNKEEVFEKFPNVAYASVVFYYDDDRKYNYDEMMKSELHVNKLPIEKSLDDLTFSSIKYIAYYDNDMGMIAYSLVGEDFEDYDYSKTGIRSITINFTKMTDYKLKAAKLRDDIIKENIKSYDYIDITPYINSDNTFNIEKFKTEKPECVYYMGSYTENVVGQTEEINGRLEHLCYRDYKTEITEDIFNSYLKEAKTKLSKSDMLLILLFDSDKKLVGYTYFIRQ